MYIHCVGAHALFASLQINWVTTTSRLFGPVICLPNKDGGIPLSALPKDAISKLAGLFSTTILFVLMANQVSCVYHLKSLLYHFYPLYSVVIGAFALQSVDLGFIFQIES